MPFRFQDPGDLAGETARIATEQIDRALGETRDDSLDVHGKIHQARKRCKKLRGLLRLVRPAIGSAYKKENVWFRDSVRPLSDLRDARVMLATYDDVMDFFSDEVDRRAFAPLRRRLTFRMRDVLSESAAPDGGIDGFRKRMKQARDRVPVWSSRVRDPDALSAGAGKTYRRGRNAMSSARAHADGSKFHEWRKRVKYHWIHCRLLLDAWDPMISARAEESKHLSDLLGEEHDLTVFRHLLHEHPDLAAAETRQAAMLAMLDRRRAMLRRDAVVLGKRLFAPDPEALEEEFRQFLAAWSEEEGGD